MKFGTMKYCVMTAAGVLLSLAGCVSDRAEDYDPAVELAFRPQLYVPMRAEVQEGQEGQQGGYPEEQPFGVSAWLLPADESFADHAAEAREFLTRCEVAYDGGEWLYTPPKEWSPKSTRLSFIGYAPYGAAAGCDAQKGVTFADVDTSLAQTDLLYTDVVADRSKTQSGGVVAMPFRHALCKVGFRIKNLVAPAEKVVVRSITLDAAAVRGSFRSLPSPAWQLGEGRAPIRFFEGEAVTGHTPREVGRSVLMLPQDLASAVTVEYDYTNAQGVVLHRRLSTKVVTTRLEAGRHYVYTLSVGIDEVKFLLELIENHFV